MSVYVEWLHEYMPFLFYNPILTLVVMVLLVFASFIFADFLRKHDEKVKAQKLEKLSNEIRGEKNV